MAEIAEVFDEHGDALIRFAASQVGWADAEDVVATALVGVLRTAPTGLDDTRAYLYRSVANAAADHWRSSDRRARRESAFVMPTSLESGEPTDDEIRLCSALVELSPQQRAFIHLNYWEDLTPASIAQALDVSEGTVKRQLARARARLRKALHHADR